jgi:hypothetical protein
MLANVGGLDRALRVVLGLGLLAAGWLVPAVGWWGLLGLVPLTTGLLRWCPPYALLGINTCARP